MALGNRLHCQSNDECRGVSRLGRLRVATGKRGERRRRSDEEREDLDSRNDDERYRL